MGIVNNERIAEKMILLWKKFRGELFHNKLHLFIVTIMWGLFALSIIAILHKIGLVCHFLGYSQNAEKVNEVFYNLSYSYLAGLIFYLINDWVPRKIRETRAKKSLSSEINSMKSLLDDVYRLIIYLKQEESNVSVEDYVTKNDLSSRIIWCKYKKPNMQQEVKKIDVKLYLQSRAEQISDILKKIISSPLFLDLNKNLANILVNFQSDQFLDFILNGSGESSTLLFEKQYSQLEEIVYIRANKYEYSKPSLHERTVHLANNNILNN